MQFWKEAVSLSIDLMKRIKNFKIMSNSNTPIFNKPLRIKVAVHGGFKYREGYAVEIVFSYGVTTYLFATDCGHYAKEEIIEFEYI